MTVTSLFIKGVSLDAVRMTVDTHLANILRDTTDATGARYQGHIAAMEVTVMDKHDLVNDSGIDFERFEIEIVFAPLRIVDLETASNLCSAMAKVVGIILAEELQCEAVAVHNFQQIIWRRAKGENLSQNLFEQQHGAAQVKESLKHRSSATQALRIGTAATIVFLTACTLGRLPHALHESPKTLEDSVPDTLGRLSPDSVGRNEDGKVVAVTLSMKPVEDSVIAQIATLSDVVMLRLDFTDITDACIPDILKMAELELLDLSGTQISDPSIRTLGKLNKLKVLRLKCLDISSETLDILLQTIPNVRIETGWSAVALNDDWLRRLSRWPRIEDLRLDAEVTDSAISVLRSFPRLKKLDLSGTRFSPQALQVLGSASSLRELNLHGSSVVDETMTHVNQLESLEVLDLSRVPISDKGISCLRNLDKLVSLRLEGTRITDKGLAALSRMQQLKVLNIQETNVTDVGCMHLVLLARLEVLIANFTLIGDAGLMQLRALNNLKVVELIGANVTATGAERLTASVPNLHIVYD